MCTVESMTTHRQTTGRHDDSPTADSPTWPLTDTTSHRQNFFFFFKLTDSLADTHWQLLFLENKWKKIVLWTTKSVYSSKQAKSYQKNTSSHITLASYSRESIVEIESNLLISTEAESRQWLWSLDVWIQARMQTFEKGGVNLRVFTRRGLGGMQILRKFWFWDQN